MKIKLIILFLFILSQNLNLFAKDDLRILELEQIYRKCKEDVVPFILQSKFREAAQLEIIKKLTNSELNCLLKEKIDNHVPHYLSKALFKIGESSNPDKYNIIKNLLNNGADPYWENDIWGSDNRNRKFICTSLIKNYEKVIEILIDLNSNFNIICNFYSSFDPYPALFIPIILKNKKLISLLVNSKIDLNIKNELGKTALHMAASTRLPELDIIKILIENGSDVNALDNKGNSPFNFLYVFKIFNNYFNHENLGKILEYILKNNNIDITIKNKDGRSLLSEIEKVLSNEGNEIDYSYSKGLLPLLSQKLENFSFLKFDCNVNNIVFRNTDKSRVPLLGAIGERFGYCNGISSLTQAFYMKALFDKNLPKLKKNDYETLITKLLYDHKIGINSKYTINGYSSLTEFANNYRELLIDLAVKYNTQLTFRHTLEKYFPYNKLKKERKKNTLNLSSNKTIFGIFSFKTAKF
jgi:ankyrin repeat protein